MHIEITIFYNNASCQITHWVGRIVTAVILTQSELMTDWERELGFVIDENETPTFT